MEEFIATLQKLNTTNDKGDATANNVKTFLKTMLGDDTKMDKFLEDLVKAGSSMYLLSIHYTVVKTILTNPDWYAEKSVGNSKELCDFKQCASIPALKTYLTQMCTPSTRSYTSTTAKCNLAALLDSDDSIEETWVESNKKQKAKKRECTRHKLLSRMTNLL